MNLAQETLPRVARRNGERTAKRTGIDRMRPAFVAAADVALDVAGDRNLFAAGRDDVAKYIYQMREAAESARRLQRGTAPTLRNVEPLPACCRRCFDSR
jgi:hypothetical protein